jgi:hypothetical protein
MRSLLFLFLFAVGSAFVVSENKPDGKWATIRLVMDGNDLCNSPLLPTGLNY